MATTGRSMVRCSGAALWTSNAGRSFSASSPLHRPSSQPHSAHLPARRIHQISYPPNQPLSCSDPPIATRSPCTAPHSPDIVDTTAPPIISHPLSTLPHRHLTQLTPPCAPLTSARFRISIAGAAHPIQQRLQHRPHSYYSSCTPSRHLTADCHPLSVDRRPLMPLLPAMAAASPTPTSSPSSPRV